MTMHLAVPANKSINKKKITSFGRTWWGAQWLNALNSIDYSNRLDRGKRYAKNGAADSIVISGNRIEANVRGTQPKPYQVNIVVPPFFDKEKKIFLQYIWQNPLILSRLLNRELPNELLQFSEQNNIKIFPHSWQDIKLNCNCPDWAVPCKHIAAVIYLVANEIDRNPFLVFDLHNFDVVEGLSKLKINLGNIRQEKIFSLEDCIQLPSHNKKENKPGGKPEMPDFSTIEDLITTIPNLFLAQTLFFSGDFKSIIQSIYRRASKAENKALLEKKKNEKKAPEDLRFQKFNVRFSPDGVPSITISSAGWGMKRKAEKERVCDFNEFLLLLAQTESKHLENYSDSFVALYRTFRFCNILVERGAILPLLFHCGTDDYKILWQPALINDSVKYIFEKILKWLPEETVLVHKASTVVSSGKGKKKYDIHLHTKHEEGLRLICSLFINYSVKNCFRQTTVAKTESGVDKKILDLFFDDRIISFTNFGEREIPNSIQLWLKRFYIGEKNFLPVISVSEMRDGFEVEVLVNRKDEKLSRMENLSTFMLSSTHENKMHLLKDLNLLSEYFPDLNMVIQTQGREKLRYQNKAFSEVLLKVLPALKLFGIKALLPKSLQQLLRPQASLKLSLNKNKKKYFSLADLMTYEWKVAIGNSFMSQKEFEQLTRSTFGIVKIRDQYMIADEEHVAKIIRALEKPVIPNSFQLLQAALSGEFENAKCQIDESLRNRINDVLKDEQTPLPVSLNANLRPYQQRGFNWLYKNSRLGLGSLLADDMGLGKTLQVITTLLKFKEDGVLNNNPALVIVPTTLITNWMKEIKNFAPDLRIHVFHGSERKFLIKNIDVIITTYGIARSENKKLSSREWSVVIVDEAQNIKNPEVAQTKEIKKIPSKIKIAMSGTPVENRLSEYWSIFDFANPNYLGNLNWFNSEYAQPIELNQDRKKLEKFKLITSPFLMRRMKTDKNIITDLPDKVENNQFCSLNKEQAALYQNLTHDLMNQVETAEGINRRGLVLKLLVVLKQVCNHPAQYLKNENLSPELSGKTMLLLQLLETIYENNEKVLIFSQFKEMGDILRQIIHNHFGKKALQLHGGCSRNERDEMVDAFQNQKQHDTFILSLKAGGTGLNLTSAANVIHYDLWWNPAVESQATDRAFRIGQKQKVMVHRMITKGTLEEKIDDMIRSKKALANLAVSSGEKWIGELNDKELKTLVLFGEEQN